MIKKEDVELYEILKPEVIKAAPSAGFTDIDSDGDVWIVDGYWTEQLVRLYIAGFKAGIAAGRE